MTVHSLDPTQIHELIGIGRLAKWDKLHGPANLCGNIIVRQLITGRDDTGVELKYQTYPPRRGRIDDVNGDGIEIWPVNPEHRGARNFRVPALILDRLTLTNVLRLAVFKQVGLVKYQGEGYLRPTRTFDLPDELGRLDPTTPEVENFKLTKCAQWMLDCIGIGNGTFILNEMTLMKHLPGLGFPLEFEAARARDEFHPILENLILSTR